MLNGHSDNDNSHDWETIDIEHFYVNEQLNRRKTEVNKHSCFVGSRDEKNPDSLRETKIISSKGTVRGFKNRVRAGIATFLEQQDEAKVCHFYLCL